MLGHRLQAHAVWLRHKLVNMMTPEAVNAQVPHARWRQRVYRLVSSVWFDGFVYVMILCNTPIILCEVAVRPPVAVTITNTIKALNL